MSTMRVVIASLALLYISDVSGAPIWSLAAAYLVATAHLYAIEQFER